MAIITVSRQLGSFGDEIAQRVGNELNYEFVDKIKIGEALATQGFSAIETEKYDEKKPSFWESFSIQRRKFLHLIGAVIYDFAGKNNTVILGRAGQFLLKDIPGVLHIRIIAPFGIRLKRIMEREGHDEKSGERLLRRHDRESAGYIRSFWAADWDDQNLYDMVINTKVISTNLAVKMIVDSVDSPEFKVSLKKTSDKLADLSLLQKVETIFLKVSGLDRRVSVASVEKGVVTLTGAVYSMKEKEDFERKVIEIKGVESIKNNIVIVQPAGRL